MAVTAPSVVLHRAGVGAMSRISVGLVLTLVLAVVLGWLVLPPVLTLAWISLTDVTGASASGVSLVNYGFLLPRLMRSQVILNSFAYALGSAVIATVVGTTLAWLVERTNAPFRRISYLAAFLSLATPLIVKVLGFILLLGPGAGVLNRWFQQLTGRPLLNVYSLPGMILIDGLMAIPMAFLLLGPPLRMMDPSLEESASASGATQWAVLRRITLPLALPSIGAVFLLIFITTLQGFDVPAMIGTTARVYVFTSEIYLELKTGLSPSYGQASALAVVLTLLVLASFYPYYRATKKASSFASVTGKGFRLGVVDLGRLRPLAGIATLVLPVFVVLPLLPIVWASLVPFYAVPTAEALKTVSLQNFRVAMANPIVVRSVWNSFLVSGAAATVVMGITVVLAWMVIRGRGPAAAHLDQLGMMPLVIPGIVLGLAVLRTYVHVPLPVYGTLLILIIAFVTHYLPYGLRYSSAGLLSISRELEESAQMSGASWWQMFRRVVVPLLIPALIAGWIFIFLGTFRFLGIPVLLYSSGTEMVASTIFDLWLDAQLPELAAFTVLLSAALMVVAALAYGITRRYGTHV